MHIQILHSPCYLCIHTNTHTSTHSLTAVSISDDSTLLAAAFGNSRIKLWSLSPKKLYTLKTPTQMQQVTLAAGGNIVTVHCTVHTTSALRAGHCPCVYICGCGCVMTCFVPWGILNFVWAPVLCKVLIYACSPTHRTHSCICMYTIRICYMLFNCRRCHGKNC